MSNENWHLEKKFTISFIMAFIGAVCSGVWHVAEFKYQITENTLPEEHVGICDSDIRTPLLGVWANGHILE